MKAKEWRARNTSILRTEKVFNSDSLLLMNEGKANVLFATLFSVLGAIFVVALTEVLEVDSRRSRGPVWYGRGEGRGADGVGW